jgi:hypothetical protein
VPTQIVGPSAGGTGAANAQEVPERPPPTHGPSPSDRENVLEPLEDTGTTVDIVVTAGTGNQAATQQLFFSPDPQLVQASLDTASLTRFSLGKFNHFSPWL